MAIDKKNEPFRTIGKIIIFFFSHTFDFIVGPLVVLGSIFCLAYFEPWPLKLICMALWNAAIYFIAKLLDRLTENNLN